MIYVSDSVTPVLNHAQGDWFGASLYDYVHPEDQVYIYCLNRAGSLNHLVVIRFGVRQNFHQWEHSILQNAVLWLAEILAHHEPDHHLVI